MCKEERKICEQRRGESRCKAEKRRDEVKAIVKAGKKYIRTEWKLIYIRDIMSASGNPFTKASHVFGWWPAGKRERVVDSLWDVRALYHRILWYSFGRQTHKHSIVQNAVFHWPNGNKHTPFDGKCNFLSLRYHLLGGLLCFLFFIYFPYVCIRFTRQHKKKKKKLSEKKMKGKSTFHFHSFFGFSFFFFPSARTMYYKFVRECSFWRHKFSRFVHFSFSFFPLFLFIRFCSSFVPPFPGYLRFCYLFSQYFFFFILFLFFSVVFKFGNKKASFS